MPIAFEKKLMESHMNFINITNYTKDIFANTFYSRFREKTSMLFYVIESANWSIKWDGKYITRNLNNQKLLHSRITTTDKRIRNQIIHFGSVNTFLSKNSFNIPHNSNKTILTWFHVEPEDSRIKFVKEAHEYVDLVHTSNSITKEKLIEIGIPEEKIVIIPLGVDISLFNPVDDIRKKEIRREIGIPDNKIIIGSFQKDGTGWGDGIKPKFVKGPDIFVKVIKKLKKDFDIFVLLLGPARGYVKKELDAINVPYKHLFLKNYKEIPKYYNSLDLYLITSRAEGGPKAIHESMLSKIPLVSTKVGMVVDIIKDGYNGFISEIDDVDELYEKCSKLIENKDLAKNISNNAYEMIKEYSWKNVAREYYDKLYCKFLN